MLAVGKRVERSTKGMCDGGLTISLTVEGETVRGKNSGEALNLLLYWIPFGFFALIDATSISDIPAYFLLKTAFLLFLFLPQTKGAVLIFQKVIEPAARAFEAAIVKINNSI
ncbi:TB2/DP1, HVA22 family [Cooperia oncophora]